MTPLATATETLPRAAVEAAVSPTSKRFPGSFGNMARFAFALVLGWACNQGIGLLFVSTGSQTKNLITAYERAINSTSSEPDNIGTLTGVKVCFSLSKADDIKKTEKDDCAPFRKGERELEFVILRPLSDTELPVDPPNPTCPTVRGFQVSCGAFFKYEQLSFPPIWTPTIEDSVHSFVRKLEMIAYHRDGEVKLCSGTRRLLSAQQCRTSAKIENLFSVYGLDSLIDGWVRFGAMLCGLVQFLTWVLFWFLVLAVEKSSRINIGPTVTLFKTRKENGNTKLEQLDGNQFRAAYDTYRRSAARSIGDQLWVAFIPFEQPAGAPPNAADTEALDQVRTRLREVAEDSSSSFEKMAENILKLSFGGTIIGIGQSLFEARNLDTADPIEKILVKSKMFAGIGTAFGNTLVGIGLSMVALLIVELVLVRWFRKIDADASIIRDFAASGSPLIVPPVKAPLTPVGNILSGNVRHSLLEKIGGIGLLIFIVTMAAAHRTSLVSYAARAWSEISKLAGAVQR